MARRKRMTLLSFLTPWAFLLGYHDANAANNPTSCTNDIDCIATPDCGGDVCTYTSSGSMTCTPAGTGPKGADGWCTADTDCKCYAQGARCNGVYCTFTTLSSTSAGGGGWTGNKGTAGSSGAGGTGTAGREGNTGGASGTVTASGGGGCAVAGQPRLLDGWLGTAAIALFLVLSRRRVAPGLDVQSQDVVVHSPVLRRMHNGRSTSRPRPNDAYSIRVSREWLARIFAERLAPTILRKPDRGRSITFAQQSALFRGRWSGLGAL